MAKKWQQNGKKRPKNTRKRDDQMVINMATIWRSKWRSKWRKKVEKDDKMVIKMATKWRKNTKKL